MKSALLCSALLCSALLTTGEAAETLDVTQKVGTAYFVNAGGASTIVTGFNTARTKMIASCSPDHVTWTSQKFVVAYPPYAYGGAYPVPDFVDNVHAGINEYAFHVGYNGVSGRDDIVDMYIDKDAGCTLQMQSHFEDPAQPGEFVPTRLGPRLGVMLDATDTAWVFAVSNFNSAPNTTGKLVALEVAGHGMGAGTWTHVSNHLGKNFWAPPGVGMSAPIVAGRTAASGDRMPLVATALNATTLAAVLWDGVAWSEAELALPGGVGMISAIALSSTSPDVKTDHNFNLYEYIFVAGTNGHLYRSRLRVAKAAFPNQYSLAPFLDLGAIDATWSVSPLSDSLSASWYLADDGFEYQTVFARGITGAGVLADFVTDVSAAGAVMGWNNVTPGSAGGWLGTDQFVGGQMAMRWYDPVAKVWLYDVGAACTNGTNILCTLKYSTKPLAVPTAWSFPTMP